VIDPDAPSMLGDCILHVTHHEMRQECWRTVIETYSAFAEQWPELAGDALRDAGREAYKAVYERALLNVMRTEGQTGDGNG
jgi:hypothetical protein